MSTTAGTRPFKEYAYDGVLSLVLFVITGLTIFPLFQGDYTSSWGSIESAFLSEAQFVATNYPNIGWYPCWYLGFPFPRIYVPLLPYAVASMHVLMSNWSIGHSYRILTALGYSASPPALFAITKYLSKKKAAGFITGLTYALVPTFLIGMVPSHVEVLAIYGEGPHILSLPFLILSELQFLRCIQKPSLMRTITFSVLMATLALTNVIGLFSFFLVALVTLLVEGVFGTIGRAFRALLLSSAVAMGLVAFQYTPDYVLALVSYGDIGFSSIPSVAIILLGIIVAISALIARSYSSKFIRAKGYFLAFLWIIVFGAIVLGRQLWGLTVAPQPIRYAPEFDMGVSILLGLLVTGALDLVSNMTLPSLAIRKGLKLITVSVVMLGLLLSANTLLQFSFQVTQPSKEVSNTPEYKLAKWLSAHVVDERIYASGTVSFWLDVFSSVQQIRGGSDGAGTNGWWPHVTYQINNGPDPVFSILWAQALNVKYIVVTFRNASTAYHDFAFPEKFNGVLPLRFYVEGFGVYEVPLHDGALVQCVPAHAAMALSPIHDMLDREHLSSYLNVTDSQCGQHTQVKYLRINSDEIQAFVSNATTDTAILLKMTYDQGWRAEVNGSPLTLSAIGPDFILAHPQIQGNYQIALHFQNSQGVILGHWVSIATLLGVLVAEPVRGLYWVRHKGEKRIPTEGDEAVIQ